jgi:hypothetical protein
MKKQKPKPMTDQEVSDWYQASIMAAVSEYVRRMGMPDVARAINAEQQHPHFHELLSVFQASEVKP